MPTKSLLLDNYKRLAERLEEACLKANRSREEISLVAVSKFHRASDIAVIAEAGQMDFGENYVQEAKEKRAILDETEYGPKISWHMIGGIQSRKAAQVAGNFALVHTLDSIKLADGMEKALVARGARQPVLIEVNIANEPQKSGVGAENLSALANHVLENCPHLDLRGLMCLPPVFDSGDAARPFFARLRKLRDFLAGDIGFELRDLSMGMSGDFEGAIAEGATYVRIGTEIFGPRPVKKPGI